MFSKVISRVSQYQQLTSLQTRAFRASAVANANQKPSIGDAVTILQSKVSGINQVVSNFFLAQTQRKPFSQDFGYQYKIDNALCVANELHLANK